jgi:hypothetical protein
MTNKHHDSTKQHHEAAPSARPVLNEKTEDSMAAKRRDEGEKSVRHNFSVEDKRKAARVEHTNGSTPKRDL